MRPVRRNHIRRNLRSPVSGDGSVIDLLYHIVCILRVFPLPVFFKLLKAYFFKFRDSLHVVSSYSHSDAPLFLSGSACAPGSFLLSDRPDVSHYYTKSPVPFQAFQTKNPAEHTTLSRQCVHCPQYILPDQSVCDVQNHLKLRFSAAIAAIVIGIRRSP